MTKTLKELIIETLKEIYQLNDLEATVLAQQQPFLAIAKKFTEKLLTQKRQEYQLKEQLGSIYYIAKVSTINELLEELQE